MGEDPLSRSRKEGQGLPRASMERAEFGQESGFHSSCPNPCRGGASGSGREAVSSQVFLGRAWPGIFSINLECSTFASVPSYIVLAFWALARNAPGGPLLYLLRASISNARVKSFPSMFTHTWV